MLENFKNLIFLGYGHSTPKTAGGRAFTVVYAMIGIPLGLVMFQSIGDCLNRGLSIIIRTMRRAMKARVTEASEMDLIMTVTTISLIINTVGALVFCHFEGWSYFDSVYYCFITLTTIGFGDMVALQKNEALKEKPGYVIFALIFILFGLTVVAATLNLVVLKFMTLNTEDERRDEAQALKASQVAVRLDGDVITSNGSIISGHMPDETTSLDDLKSVCSCTCNKLLCSHPCFPIRHMKPQRRHATYTIRRSPGRISHLVPMHTLSSTATRDDMCSTYEEEIADTEFTCSNPYYGDKRESF